MCILWLKGFYLFYGISNLIKVIDQKNSWFNVVLIIMSCYCIFFFFNYTFNPQLLLHVLQWFMSFEIFNFNSYTLSLYQKDLAATFCFDFVLRLLCEV